MAKKRKVSPEQAEEIRDTYYQPTRIDYCGKRWYISMDLLARLHSVSQGTIQQVIDKKGVYAKD